jgi:hypothetical protein
MIGSPTPVVDAVGVGSLHRDRAQVIDVCYLVDVGENPVGRHRVAQHSARRTNERGVTRTKGAYGSDFRRQNGVKDRSKSRRRRGDPFGKDDVRLVEPSLWMRSAFVGDLDGHGGMSQR